MASTTPADESLPHTKGERLSYALRDAVHEGWPRQRYVELAAQIAREVAELARAGASRGGLRPEVVRLNLVGYPVITAAKVDVASPCCAPEARAGSNAGAAADVYSVGAVLFLLFAGEDPPLRWPHGIARGRPRGFGRDRQGLPRPASGLASLARRRDRSADALCVTRSGAVHPRPR